MSRFSRFRTRITDYIKVIADDYATASKDLGTSIKTHPFRSAAVVGALAGFGYASTEAPGEKEYLSEVLMYSQEIGLTPIQSVRKDCLEYVNDILHWKSTGRLKVYRLGAITLVTRSEYPWWLKSYKGKTVGLDHPKGFLDRDSWENWFVDIGFMGRFKVLEEKLTDFDLVD